MDWLKKPKKVEELREKLESWLESSASSLEQLLAGYGLRVEARRLLRGALRDYIFFQLPHEVIGYYRCLIAEEGEFRGGFEELEQLRRIPYDNVM